MFEVRPVKAGEIDQALVMLLAEGSGDGGQLAERVTAFRDLADQEGYDLSRQVVAVCDGEIAFTALQIPSGGHTAFVMMSAGASTRDGAVQAVQQLVAGAFAQGYHLLQAMFEPEDMARREISLAAGFRPLTDLMYLSRLAHTVVPAIPPVAGVSWLEYDAARHELFKSIIADTYSGSLDCPELENLRDMEDVVCGHKAAGQFDPRWWKLLCVDDQPAGALLLSPLTQGDTMELTYMGICPAMRGRGLGGLVLSEAIQCGRACGRSAIMLAVDCRNHFACRMYESFGFTEVFRRSAVFLSSRW